MHDPRRHLLLSLFRAGLARVDGRRCTREALAGQGGTERVWVAAIGKAAAAMAAGAHEALGARIERTLVITKEGHAGPGAQCLPGAEILESSHPLPDARSIAAGERLLQWCEELPADVRAVFLVSGGASSLVEVPAPGASLEALVELNASGLRHGVPIGALNAQRARLSLIKGGRLAARLRGRDADVLFISDVPGDDPAVIGSGLLGPPPGADPAGDDRLRRRIVASIEDAIEGVCEAARRRGLGVRRDPGRFAGEAERLAVRFAHELHMGAESVRVWGGESVVHLPERAGRGGRNQHLALTAARLIAGRDELMLLAAGTDGTDGPTTDAGALVDGDTCARLALAELDVARCLREADSGTALEASGDLIHTGPTGTNVGDLVIGLKLTREAAAALAAGGEGVSEP